MSRQALSRYLGMLAVFAAAAMFLFGQALDRHDEDAPPFASPSFEVHAAMPSSHLPADLAVQPAGAHCHSGIACIAVVPPGLEYALACPTVQDFGPPSAIVMNDMAGSGWFHPPA